MASGSKAKSDRYGTGSQRGGAFGKNDSAMITEIPSAADFHAAGVNQLYLAWQISMHAVEEHEQLDALPDEETDRQNAATEYWIKSQPALANAFGLIQQAMEMALKGRIAAVSPYLLIGRDPKDWPRGVDTDAVPFSEFRTLDAADLMKVHNTFSATPLDDKFRVFWEGIRRDRNKIMHSISARSFDPATLVRSILIAAETLFDDRRWPERLFEMEQDGKYAAYGITDGSSNVVMRQVDIAIRHLTPAERKQFFGYQSDRRAYVCPDCYYNADRDWQDTFPALAQFTTKSKGATALHCIVCEQTTEVQRADCAHDHCEGNVIHDGMCLTCLWSQDIPHGFSSPLRQEGPGYRQTHSIDLQRGHGSTSDTGLFVDDAAAIEHARLAMVAPHLQSWTMATVRSRPKNPLSLGDKGTVLGTWQREQNGLRWLAGVEVDVLGNLSCQSPNL